MKVVSTVIKARFEKYQVSFPENWDVVFVPQPYTQEQLSEACRGADFLLVGSVDAVSGDVLCANKQLKLIHTEGSGFELVDVETARELGIPVCNNHGANNAAVAEHTVGLMLAVMRQTSLRDRQIREIGYAACQKEARAFGECELFGKKVGLIGMGAIGKEVARRLQFWGCEVNFYDPYPPNVEIMEQLHIHSLSLEELLKTSDVISVHLPAMPSTINLLDYPQFALMKKSAIVINVSRGVIVNQDALVDALVEGKIAGAGVDTIDPEPMPADHPFLNLPEDAGKRLLMTPHIAGTTDEAFTRMLVESIDNFRRVEKQEKPLRIVNM